VCSPAVEEPLHQVSIFLHFSCKCLILMLLIQGFRFYFFLSCVAKISTKVKDETSPLKRNYVFMLVYAI
jgi:hypothetical protein